MHGLNGKRICYSEPSIRCSLSYLVAMKREFTRLIYSCLAVLAFSATTFTQTPTPTPAPPATDIFVVDLTTTPGGKLKLGQPVKITNWAGYNNQPSFLPDGKSILYTSHQRQAG